MLLQSPKGQPTRVYIRPNQLPPKSRTRTAQQQVLPRRPYFHRRPLHILGRSLPGVPLLIDESRNSSRGHRQSHSVQNSRRKAHRSNLLVHHHPRYSPRLWCQNPLKQSRRNISSSSRDRRLAVLRTLTWRRVIQAQTPCSGSSP